ncbi:hypothetical protein ACWGK1_00555 [Streptomyces wedmorensis]
MCRWRDTAWVGVFCFCLAAKGIGFEEKPLARLSFLFSGFCLAAKLVLLLLFWRFSFWCILWFLVGLVRMGLPAHLVGFAGGLVGALDGGAGPVALGVLGVQEWSGELRFPYV